MVRNDNVPHDVLHQLVQEDGMLGKGEVDLEKNTFPNDIIILNLGNAFIKCPNSMIV